MTTPHANPMMKPSAVHRRWAARVREEALRRTLAAPREACRIFDKELTQRQQLNAAREIVETRTSELCRAYPGVIDVSFGYRLRRDRTGKRHRIVQQPCVRFLVARKRDPQRLPRPEDTIPPRLLTYCTIGDQRKLCAVPTDVEDSTLHGATIAHGGPQGIAVKWKDTSAVGAIACVVERDGVPGTPFAIGCRHVLSLSAWFFNQNTWGATVSVEGNGVLGVTRAVAGTLQEAPARSFDAQLFEVTDREALREAAGDIVFTGYADSIDDIPAQYDILTPHGTRRARFVERIEPGRLAYQIGDVWIAHDVTLIRSQPGPATVEGDSGSPVVTGDGKMLLGMHLAGIDGKDAQGVYTAAAYMIPAWELLDPANYTGVGTETWTLMNP